MSNPQADQPIQQVDVAMPPLESVAQSVVSDEEISDRLNRSCHIESEDSEQSDDDDEDDEPAPVSISTSTLTTTPSYSEAFAAIFKAAGSSARSQTANYQSPAVASSSSTSSSSSSSYDLAIRNDPIAPYIRNHAIGRVADVSLEQVVSRDSSLNLDQPTEIMSAVEYNFTIGFKSLTDEFHRVVRQPPPSWRVAAHLNTKTSKFYKASVRELRSKALIESEKMHRAIQEAESCFKIIEKSRTNACMYLTSAAIKENMSLQQDELARKKEELLAEHRRQLEALEKKFKKN